MSLIIPEGFKTLAGGREAHPRSTSEPRTRPPATSPSGRSRAGVAFHVTNPAVFAALDRRLIAEIPSGWKTSVQSAHTKPRWT